MRQRVGFALALLVASPAAACSMSNFEEYLTNLVIYCWAMVLGTLAFAILGTAVAIRRRRWLWAAALPALALTSGGVWLPGIGAGCGFAALVGSAWHLELVAIVTLLVLDDVPRERWSLGALITVAATYVLAIFLRQWILDRGLVGDAVLFEARLDWRLPMPVAALGLAFLAPLLPTRWARWGGLALSRIAWLVVGAWTLFESVSAVRWAPEEGLRYYATYGWPLSLGF